jgi:hypothetical protein
VPQPTAPPRTPNNKHVVMEIHYKRVLKRLDTSFILHINSLIMKEIKTGLTNKYFLALLSLLMNNAKIS